MGSHWIKVRGFRFGIGVHSYSFAVTLGTDNICRVIFKSVSKNLCDGMMSDEEKYAALEAGSAELNDAGFDPLFFDPVIEAYKKDVDRTILRENLKLSPQERSEKFLSFMRSVKQLREAAEQSRRS